MYSVEEVILIILENNSLGSNGVDLEDGIISDSADSGSEDEIVNNLVEEVHQQSSHYSARNGQIWSKEPIAQHATGRVQVYNLVREQQGPTREVLRICANSPADSFKVFLTPEIVNITVVYTNREGLLQINNWQRTLMRWRFILSLVFFCLLGHTRTRAQVCQKCGVKPMAVQITEML